jgi:hypothetical protein
VAAVATVLVSRAGEITGATDPAARTLTAADAFHAAYWVIFGIAVLGALAAAITFPRPATQAIAPGSTPATESPLTDTPS